MHLNTTPEWKPSQNAWALVPEQAAGVANVVAGLAFEASSSAGLGSAPGRIPGVRGEASRALIGPCEISDSMISTTLYQPHGIVVRQTDDYYLVCQPKYMPSRPPRDD
jgi:hypothetical protein